MKYIMVKLLLTYILHHQYQFKAGEIMALEQHEDNRFTKERDDVEKYLLRIIQRYFDITNVYSQESIEAIIVESLARYKQDIYHEKGGFLFSLNQRTGHIILTIQDLNGEEAFENLIGFSEEEFIEMCENTLEIQNKIDGYNLFKNPIFTTIENPSQEPNNFNIFKRSVYDETICN